MPWTALTSRQASLAAYRELRHNPRRSNQMIARQAGVGSTTVATARAKLEQAGHIPVIPVSERQQQPRPRQPSPARDAIAQGAITPREIADAARISPQAAWKAWKKNQQRLAQARAAAAEPRRTPVIQALPAPVPRLDAAACASGAVLPPSAWTGPASRADRAIALGICIYLCPVAKQCREHALSNSQVPGIAGGMTEAQRRLIRRNRNSPPSRETENARKQRWRDAQRAAGQPVTLPRPGRLTLAIMKEAVMRDPAEALGPGQFTESGEVVYGKDPGPPVYGQPLSQAQAEAADRRCWPESRGPSNPSAAAAAGIEPDVIS